MDLLERYFNGTIFWGNAVWDYVIALGIFIGLLIVFKIFELIILSRLRNWADKTKTILDDYLVKIIEDIPGIFYGYIALYVALQPLIVPLIIVKITNALLIILIFYWGTRAASELIEYLLHRAALKKGQSPEKTSSYFAITLVIKIVLWSVGLLLILSNLGVDITALVASLGIGGIAIALALQNILSDLFSSFSIYFDKPFEIGDYVVVGAHSGTVKKIGLKTTRIQALQGEEIVISNHELTSTRIQNFKKMKKRRIVFGFGVVYGTTPTKLKKIPKIIKTIVKDVAKCTIDRVHFKEFGDFSLNFEVVYFINSREYADYMDAQQKMNLAIIKEFEKEDIEMAFPTQTIYLNKES
ncbi:mechanosensitive ion channel family protein [Candidatus Peregrinibacteria bacterium]|nr:mechanosensitive ion channel family protein [Candidatus Peregrinibacteria bacterium]